jgi:hypothetical protein
MRADCEEIRELCAEMALGIASGEERARVLDHAAGCRDCRRELEQLTAVTDELLFLAPEAEPPRGFEERVLARIAPPKPPRRLARRFLRPVVAVAAGAAIASVALVIGYSGDHRLANEYRQALAAADGSRFVAAPVRDGAGVKRGSVSLYQGKPSWLVVALSPGERRAVARAEVVSRSGKRFALPGFALRGGVWGGPLPIAPGEVASVQLIGPAGGSVFVAYTRAAW